MLKQGSYCLVFVPSSRLDLVALALIRFFMMLSLDVTCAECTNRTWFC